MVLSLGLHKEERIMIYICNIQIPIDCIPTVQHIWPITRSPKTKTRASCNYKACFQNGLNCYFTSHIFCNVLTAVKSVAVPMNDMNS